MPRTFYNIAGGAKRKSKRTRRYRTKSKRHTKRSKSNHLRSRSASAKRVIGRLQQNIEAQLLRANNAAIADIIIHKERRYPMTRREIKSLQRIHSRAQRRVPNPCRKHGLRDCPKDSCVKRTIRPGKRVCSRRPGWRPVPPAQPSLVQQLTNLVA